MLTCSFDHTLSIWNVKTGKRHLSLIGHSAEISAGKFNYEGSIVVSGSMDGTMRLWEAESVTPLGTWFENRKIIVFLLEPHFLSFESNISPVRG